MSWSAEEEASLIEFKERGLSTKEIAEEMSLLYKKEFSYWSVQKKIPRLKPQAQPSIPIAYKETHEIASDGSHKSDKLLQMTAAQQKNPEYLLKAHGFETQSWELVTAKNNIWNSYSKQDGVMTLYASKITVKPKQISFNWETAIKRIEAIPQKFIEPEYIRVTDYLNLPLFDMHFGISDYEYYLPTQRRIAGLIEQGYKGVLFIIGQDMLHNDNFKGTTANGTPIDKVDMEKAWEDAMLFYIPLIELALKRCQHVKIMYSKGNHDESMSWAFVKALKIRFPQADVDSSFRERKAHMLGNNFIGVNHGDKKKEDKLTENFSTEFLFEWAKAKTREIFTGHLHTERVIDKGGVVQRRMPTANKIDGYHDDHGYTTAHKRFEVLEYSEDAVMRIHYV
ncbi:hypothetical protein [Metabacillus sp. 84]|uniref:hypothetical protein n=1 Tax=Metabacillus sp. 84 TaxID=3404705 RepID=UPI003CFAB674